MREEQGGSGLPFGLGIGGPGAPRTLLVPYVLLALSFAQAHGYLLQQWLRTLGFWSMDLTTLYRTLRQLERDGLVCSAWDPAPQGPARRVYTLTDAGRALLASWAQTLDQYQDLLARFGRLYAGQEPPPTP